MLPPVDDATDADPLRRDVRVGPGRIGVIFEDVARGVGARVAVDTRESPLQGIVEAGWIITSVNNVDVTGVGAAGAEAVVEKRGDLLYKGRVPETTLARRDPGFICTNFALTKILGDV